MMLVICFVTFVAWWLHRQMRDIQQMSQGSKQPSSTGASSRSSVQLAEETSPGVVVIGKITLFTDQVRFLFYVNLFSKFFASRY